MIFDCHAHILNIDFVPDEFIGIELPLSKKLMHKLSKFLSVLWPFSGDDILEDVAAFQRNMGQTQEENFVELQSKLPLESCICIVTMDFYSVKGNAKKGIETQLLECLAIREKYGHKVCKVFMGIDPNNPEMDSLMSKYIGVVDGIKLYPPINCLPTHANLEKLYSKCIDLNLPITVHCGDSGVSAPTFLNDEAKEYGNPSHWEKVLIKFPDLKINLAHFGSGNKEWELKIVELMKRFPNVHTDTAYSIGSPERLERYQYWLATEPLFAKRLLFGTDYFILNMATKNLLFCIFKTADCLGATNFLLATETNPKRFFNLSK